MKIKVRKVSSNERLEASMLALPQIDLSQSTRHVFAEGLYLRVLARPAGTTIAGKRHKHEHFYIVLEGDVTVVGDDDGFYERCKAPRIIVSKAGTKRAVYSHADSICITVHANPKNIRDIEELEAYLVEPDPLSPVGPGNVLDREKVPCLS